MHFPGAWSQGPVTRKLVDNPTGDTGSALQLYPKKRLFNVNKKQEFHWRKLFFIHHGPGCEKVLDYLHIF